MTAAQQWILMTGETALGTLVLEELDQPWWYCHFTPTPAFDQFRPFFVTEQAALEINEAARLIGDREQGQWEKAYDAIDALHLRLVGEHGQIIDDLLLHVDGDEAWFRY
jgi:hypothetical protein